MIQSAIVCESRSDLPDVAQKILATFQDKKIFLVSGKMGAGKTTLIKELCKLLDVVDIVNSPTFSIINEYKTTNGSSIYHFDLYRIKVPEELLDIGYEEYIFSGSVCLIEWPELAESLMPESYVLINIEVNELNGNRIFKLNLCE